MNNKEIKFNSPLDVDYSKFAELHAENKLKSLKPTKLKFTLSNIIKAQFLIHQINFYTLKKGGLQIHHKTYAEFFSLSPNDFGVIIHFLEDINIIKCVHKGTHANEEKNIIQSLSKYVIVNPFDINDSTQYQTHTYHVDTTINLKQKVKPLPEFMYRYAVDCGVLKNEASIYVKRKMNTDAPKIKVLTKNEQIAQLEAENERLKAILDVNQIDYTPSISDQIRASWKPSSKANSRALQAAAEEQPQAVEIIHQPEDRPEIKVLQFEEFSIKIIGYNKLPQDFKQDSMLKEIANAGNSETKLYSVDMQYNRYSSGTKITAILN